MGFFDSFRKKKAPAEAGAKDSAGSASPPDTPGTRQCFVLCGFTEPGDLSRAGAVVAGVFGPGHSVELSDGGVVMVKRGGQSVGFLAHIPAPIPYGEAEANADGNFLWPGGKEEAARHRSHVIVTNLGGGELSPVESAIVVSRLALVALTLFDGTGVYWGNARVCNSRGIFEDFCKGMSAEHVPVPVWLRFQFVRAAGSGRGLYTLGMSQFGLMDIEVDGTPMGAQDLFEFVSNIAHYLIQRGAVIADGNTVGGSASERILVRHRPSMIDKDKRVYKIVFGGPEV